MLTSLEIENFRAFSKMKLEGLARVNLLVGKNGSGKSSVLEAVKIVAGKGAPLPLLVSLTMRGGDWAQDDREAFRKERSVHPLFHGLRAEEEGALLLSAQTETSAISVEIRKTELTAEQVQSKAAEGRPLIWRPAADTYAYAKRRKVIMTLAGADQPVVALELNRNFRVAASQLVDDEANGRPGLGANLVPCSGIADGTLGLWFAEMTLTPAEERVTEVLRLLRPDVERLVWIPESEALQAGFYLKLKGREERLPLSQFGEGLRRLLGIAIVVNAGNIDILLIDEIDTGLHHTVLEQLWRALIDLSRLLDVQIFATTHSGDCIRSLAWLIEDQPSYGPDISLHRIDPALETSVRYGADEIALAAKHHVEVRG